MTKEELLNSLDSAETPEEIRSIGAKLLEMDPKSPYGKLAVWETMEHGEAVEELDMLREALDAIRAVVEAKNIPSFVADDRDSVVYCTIMMELGFCLLYSGNVEEAYEIAEEFSNYDDEGIYPSRTMLYLCLLELERYEDIISKVDEDINESVVGEHARAIALIETKADSYDIRDAVNYAISLAPNVPFYVTQIWDLPESEDDIPEELADDVMDASYLIEPWCKTETRLAILSAPTFLFGYITDRLTDEKEIKLLRESYEDAGLTSLIEEAKERLAMMERKGSTPEEIDAEALSVTVGIIEDMLENRRL